MVIRRRTQTEGAAVSHQSDGITAVMSVFGQTHSGGSETARSRHLAIPDVVKSMTASMVFMGVSAIAEALGWVYQYRTGRIKY